ncbi:MAG: putative membrane protein [Phycisphaerales bacterium]|jgi:uncharacterized membrane protein
MSSSQANIQYKIGVDRKYNFWSMSLLLIGIVFLIPQWLFGSPFYYLGLESSMQTSNALLVLQKVAVAISIVFVLVAMATIPSMQYRDYLNGSRANRLLRIACILLFILLLATTLTITIAVPFNWSTWERTFPAMNVTMHVFGVLGILFSWVAVCFAPRQLRRDLELLDQMEKKYSS